MTSIIKRYNIGLKPIYQWIVVGENNEYFVTTCSCTCKDFQLKVAKKQIKKCKHMISVENGKKSGAFDNFDISIQEWQNIRKYLFSIKK